MKFPVMGIEEPAREKEKKVQMLHTVDTQKKNITSLGQIEQDLVKT
jgi:hypothetical protein